MFQRLTQFYRTIRHGLNNGLIAGGLIVFLILIGLPAALPGREPLAPLSIPLFLLLVIIFAVIYVRKYGEQTDLSTLLLNGVALGIGAAVVFVLFMSLINRWQANPELNVQDYFAEVTLETTERLSGVPVVDLHPNPTVDPLTQEFREDADLRVNPMPLRVNNADISVFDLGFVKIGGIYGTALVLAIVGLLSVPIYLLLLLYDWQALRERINAYLERPTIAGFLHWGQLLLPIFLFILFVLTVRMNYNTAFWRGVLGEDTIAEIRGTDQIDETTIVNSEILDLQDVFNMGPRATQNFQLMLAFGTIIAFMVAMRNVRFHVYPRLTYPIRLLILAAILIPTVLLAIWRVQGNDVAFILPTLDFLPDDKITMSLIMVYLVSILIALYAIVNSAEPGRFETTLVAVSGVAMLLAMPLFMDQYQTSVFNIVAINAMLGLGLNIVVGYAGLLDLGYVAFFAIGAYTYALVESNRRALDIAVANDLFFNVLTALIIVPIIVFGTLYLWRNSQRGRAEHTVDSAQRMRPLWIGAPAWLLSLGLVVFAVLVALGTSALLDRAGVFDGAGRASPFLVGLMLALMASAFAGVLLGFPVLRLRSDYLAIVTLGFGEIISIALENLENITGGAFGADNVPKPLPQGANVAEANLVILYLGIIGSALVAFTSIRLRSSRLGRSWTALRSDEDIAQAMGVNLVNAKLLAFSIGASFAGAAGLLFAARQANIRPPNFNLNISINVLALVIIGGMGSIPGVIIGAIALVGLPEMLRALAEYRILVFGALLVAMMLVRPQGLLPQPLVALEDRARALRKRGVRTRGLLSDIDAAELDDEREVEYV